MLRRLAALSALLVLLAPLQPAARAAAAADCPEGGRVRFGVEPYETPSHLVPIYDALANLLSIKMGCPVDVFISTSYNAEIDAMRAGNLDLGEFGPAGYVLAHQLAGAEAIATFNDKNGNPSTSTASIVTWTGSGIKTIADVRGKNFAYSEPSSTSGHLFPAYGLRKAGIDPDRGIVPLYAGSHTASFEAIRSHKVAAGELNSVEIAAAQQMGEYAEGDFLTLWRSDPIPNDPIAVRGSLSPMLRKRLTDAVLAIDFSRLTPAQIQLLPSVGTTRFVAQPDTAYNQIRDLVKTLDIDLSSLH